MDFFGIERDQTLREVECQHKRETESENYVDGLYFGNSTNNGLPLVVDFPSSSPLLEDLDEVDKQYLGVHQADCQTVSGNLKTLSCRSLELDATENFIDDAYFQSEKAAGTLDLTQSPTQQTPRKRSRSSNILRLKTSVDSQNATRESLLRIADVVQEVRRKTGKNLWTGSTLDLPARNSINLESRDSQGYRIPDDDHVKFHFLTEEEAATALFKCVVDIRENLLILNKPYGIPSQPGPGHKYSISSLLPLLEHRIRTANSSAARARALEPGELSITHRLDRGSTGLMLIARNRDSALKLKEAFAHRWIQKDYLCLTNGIPAYSEGFIKFRLVEKEYSGSFKLSITPLNRNASRAQCKQNAVDFQPTLSDTVLQTDMRVPVTHYKLLDRRHCAALLLCSTVSGVKHQIRVHLSMGLHTPILGDHKYSHVKYMAPQRLPAPLLNSLEIRQSKARYLLLHLHASRMQIAPTAQITPGFFDFLHRSGPCDRHNTNPEFHLTVPPPSHFRENIGRIGLKLPRFLSRLVL